MFSAKKNACHPATWIALLCTLATTAALATPLSLVDTAAAEIEAGSQLICPVEASDSRAPAGPHETAIVELRYCCAPDEGIYCRQISTTSCAAYGGTPIVTLSSCRRFCPM